MYSVQTTPGNTGGGGFSGGENFGTPKFWCLVYSCGNHSPWDTQQIRKKMFWDTHGVHKIILWDTKETFFGIRTSIMTDPDMQYTGTSISLQKNNASCRPREQEIARIVQKISAGNFLHQSEKQNLPLPQ